jgi:transposase
MANERLDVIPAKFRVIVTRRPKYAFKDAGGVIRARAPANIIESGLPTEAVLAQIAVSKYADGLPLFRQEGIHARDGVEIDRRLMAQWMGRVGFKLEILASLVLGEILKGPRVCADETSLPTLAPGTGAVKKAWLWAHARDDRPFGGSGPPMVAYRFEDSRSGQVFADILGAMAASFRVRRISQQSGGLLARRTAMPPTTSWPARTEAMTARASPDAGPIAGGASTNSTPRGTARSPPPRSRAWPNSGSSRPRCVAKIQRPAPPRGRPSRPPSSPPLFTLWQQTLPRISGKSKLAEAIRYAIARRAIFERFLTDGLIELDSNIVERAIRPQTITR